MCWTMKMSLGIGIVGGSASPWMISASPRRTMDCSMKMIFSGLEASR